MNRRSAFGSILGLPIGLGFAAGGYVANKSLATLGLRVDTSDLESARKKMDELADLPDEVKRNITIVVWKLRLAAVKREVVPLLSGPKQE